MESGDGHLGHCVEPDVVGDASDDHGDHALASWLLHVARHARQRDRRPVDAAHEEAPQHNLVELGMSTSGQVAVELE